MTSGYAYTAVLSKDMSENEGKYNIKYKSNTWCVEIVLHSVQSKGISPWKEDSLFFFPFPRTWVALDDILSEIRSELCVIQIFWTVVSQAP
jgi:hypothetical protein